MRITFAVATAVLLIALASACGPVGAPDSGGGPATTRVSSGAGPGAPAGTGTLPDLVGLGLQTAQDRSQAVGFFRLTSHDATGRGRLQILDRDWRVCAQTPAPGRHPATVQVDLAAVKLGERCPPGGDRGSTPSAAAGRMPDLTGKGLRVAREALPPDADITEKDVSGRGRLVLLDSDWIVCGTTPKAGAQLAGRPVTLAVVKAGESC